MNDEGLAERMHGFDREARSLAARVHESPIDSAQWDVAAPQRDPSEHSERNTPTATHSETAASFFDVVFLSVALVAYSPAHSAEQCAPRTSTHRANASLSSFLLHEYGAEHRMHRTMVSTSIRFRDATARTATVAEPTHLKSLRATMPLLPSVASPECPTGPPQLPFIAIRGWTSRYA
jgi:hypothetical protein